MTTQNQFIKPFNSNMLEQTGYSPEVLLDKIIDDVQLKNDAALSRFLEVAPPVISKIRSRKIPVSDSMLVRIHDATGMSIDEIRRLMGVSTSTQWSAK